MRAGITSLVYVCQRLKLIDQLLSSGPSRDLFSVGHGQVAGVDAAVDTFVFI